MRKRTLMAVAFAAGLINWSLTALAEGKPKSTDSVIDQIASDTQVKSELRAYHLLRLAIDYLSGGSANEVEAKFTPKITEQNWTFRDPKRWETILTYLAEKTSMEEYRNNPKSNSIPDQNLRLANIALKKALTQLDETSDKFAKLNMYFIASRLYRKAGNTNGIKTCDIAIEEAFQSCESNSPNDEEQVKAAYSVLNSIAYGLLPVQIPQSNPSEFASALTRIKPYTEQAYKESEKLKLRAMAMVDRLGSEDHLRRKAHRDLVLWYLLLGKTDKAEKEKQTLFQLVGFEDDGALYPQYEGCGQLVWWKKEKLQYGFDCGRG